MDRGSTVCRGNKINTSATRVQIEAQMKKAHGVDVASANNPTSWPPIENPAV
jgi:hypothetical protein